jgi:hypothetical protein
MVAANWIRYAGSVIERLCFGPETKEKFGPVRWGRWANKLSDIEMEYASNPRLYEAVGEARRTMMEIHPELFEREER